MATDVIRVGVDRLPAELSKLEGKLRSALVRGLHVGAHRGRAIMVKRTPTDRGELRASWKVKASALAAELINDAAHAGIIELGARPHKTSADGWAAIYEWVRRHPELYGAKRARTKVSASLSDAPFRGLDPEITQITWAIVKKLEREGSPPTFFVRDSMGVLEQALAAEVERQLARVAKTSLAELGKEAG